MAPTRQASGRTRDPSPRQLPTDHDHDGELRSIREYQSDQPSMRPPRPPPAPLQRDKKGKVTSTFDRSFHIRSVTRDGGAGRRGRRLRFDSAPPSRVPPSAARPRRLIGAPTAPPPPRCAIPCAGCGRSASPRPSTAAAHGEPAVRNGAARERGRRRSAYEAPNGSVAPGPVSSGAESKRRRCPRARARTSRVTRS